MSGDKPRAELGEAAAGHKLRGMQYREEGLLEQAVASYEEGLQLTPQDAELHNNLGNALRDQGQLKQARASYRQAVKLAPEFAAAHGNLGKVLRELGSPAAAVVSFQRALTLQPDYADALSGLADALMDRGQLSAAIDHYTQALSLEPNVAQTHCNLGVALKNSGQFKSAQASFETSFRLQPQHAAAHLNLSAVKRYAVDDPTITQMEDLLANPGLGARDRKHLYFALGKAYDDTGDYQRSLVVLQAGNRLQKEVLGYQLARDRNQVTAIKAYFDGRASRAAEQGVDPAGKRPIFIVGMPRSGTTLVEQILASHSAVHGAGELEALNNLLAKSGPDTPIVEPQSMESLRRAYLAALASLKVVEPVITDKMPANFRWIGFIFAAFPEARVVHLNRDPRATCWSIYKQPFTGSGLGYACDRTTWLNIMGSILISWTTGAGVFQAVFTISTTRR